MYTHSCIRTPYIYIHTCIHTHIHTLRGDAAPRDVASSIPEFCGAGGRHASFLPSSSLGPPMAARPPLIPLLPLGSSGSHWAVQASVWRPLRKFPMDVVASAAPFPRPHLLHTYTTERPLCSGLRRTCGRATSSSQIIASSLLPTSPVHPIFPSNRPSPVRSERLGSRSEPFPNACYCHGLTTGTCD